MKTKKKATLSAMLVAITSLAIFIAMFFAVLFFFRGCDGRYFPSTLDEIESAINRVKATSHAIETIEVFIGPESMIIMYAPEAQNVITKYSAQRMTGDLKRGAFTVSLNPAGPGGEFYDFPPDNGVMAGTLQDLASPNFLGYVKRRPADCPTKTLCVCDCVNFRLTTQESIFSTENAFIECEREKCIAISNVEVDNTIQLKDFLKYSGQYQTSEEEEFKAQYPRPDTIRWEGGFIMVRTGRDRYNLGEPTQQVCTRADLGSRYYYYTTDDCYGYVIKDKLFYNQRRMIAGHLQNYMADFFNLRIMNVGPNKIAFEVT